MVELSPLRHRSRGNRRNRVVSDSVEAAGTDADSGSENREHSGLKFVLSHISESRCEHKPTSRYESGVGERIGDISLIELSGWTTRSFPL